MFRTYATMSSSLRFSELLLELHSSAALESLSTLGMGLFCHGDGLLASIHIRIRIHHFFKNLSHKFYILLFFVFWAEFLACVVFCLRESRGGQMLRDADTNWASNVLQKG